MWSADWLRPVPGGLQLEAFRVPDMWARAVKVEKYPENLKPACVTQQLLALPTSPATPSDRLQPSP